MPNKPVHFPKLERRLKYPSRSSYRAYRQEIREDCLGRCVYCDAHENEIGGREVMTLDHFRPREHYKWLVNAPNNLVWCCTKCNELKGSKWPALGTSDTVSGNDGFIDPFAEDRNNYFEVKIDGRLEPLKVPAQYLIRLLSLNRSGLQLIRRRRELAYDNQVRLLTFFDSQLTALGLQLQKGDLTPDEIVLLQTDRDRLQEAKALASSLPSLDFTLY